MLQITALAYVSHSELQTYDPTITKEWIEANPEKFLTMLYELGMNTTTSITIQHDITHRNKFGNIITCDRWVGNERTDPEWIKSGYASTEAIDKSLGNKLIVDLYRLRGLIE